MPHFEPGDRVRQYEDTPHMDSRDGTVQRAYSSMVSVQFDEKPSTTSTLVSKRSLTNLTERDE